MITNTHPSIVWPIGHMSTNTFGESETVSLSLFPSRGHTHGQARSAGATLFFFGPCAVYSRSPRRSPVGALAWEEAVAPRRDSNLKSGCQFATGTFLNTHTKLGHLKNLRGVQIPKCAAPTPWAQSDESHDGIR